MRRILSTAVAFVLLSALVNHPVGAQSQSGSDQSGVSIGTAEVTLDVVVRDKRGRVVKDLMAADFQIQEDAVAQDVASFRFETEEDRPAAPAAGTATATGKTTAPGAEQPAILPNLVAIVFDRMSLDARSRAKDASLKFLNGGLNESDFVGVFVTDLSLNAVQPFTRDRALVRKGIEAALSASNAASAASTKEQVRTLSDRLSALNAGGPAANPTGGQGSGGGAGAAGADIGLAAAERMQLEMTVRSLETFEDLERTEQGHATTSGLSAIVSALGQVPGRKAVIFFSEGVSLPPDVIPHFRSVISNANRANVSFYTVDAAGLRAVSTTSETAKELASQANRRLEQAASGTDAVGSLTIGAERNEDLIRADPNSGLGQLARETGGTYVSGTNDPGARLKVVDEDLRTHYVLTYVPKNLNFDGQFRKVSVTVKRADTRVQTREGYFAVPSIGALAVLPYEAKPLAFLGSGKTSQAIQLRVLGLSFPQKQGTGLVPVLVQAPMSAFTFSTDQNTKTFKTDFTIVALVKDEDQTVVRKLSNHYVLNGPLEKLDAAMAGNVLFYRETTLDAGKYTVEAVAYDAPSERLGTKRSGFAIAPAGTLQISSMVIVDRTEKLGPEDQNQENPLRLGEMLLYPNIGTPLSKTKTKQMSFYAAVRANGTAPTKATIEILQKGQKLAELPVDLGKPDATGRIQFANSLPLEPFPPGAYELRLSVTDGTTSTASSTTFSVVP
jgi:VWFA-related protein